MPETEKLSWNDPVEKIKGLGPPRSQFLTEKGFSTVGDLLLRVPLRFIDRRAAPEFAKLDSASGREITAVGRIESVGEKGYRRKRRLIVIIGDGTGFLMGVWFNNYHYLTAKLTPGRLVAFSGKVGFYDGPQIIHPEVTILDEKSETVMSKKIGLIPVYPSGDEWEKVNLQRWYWPRLIRQIIEQWDGEGPHVPSEILNEESLIPLAEAVKYIHLPESVEEYDRGVETMKFAELFHHQILMVILRRRRRQGLGIAIEASKRRYLERFQSQLPFELSPGQRSVLGEIEEDVLSKTPMYRLLQGEVGSGKTVVALGAASLVAGSGYQTAIMAPTELLARQHHENARRYCEPAGLKPVLLAVGRDRAEIKRSLNEAASGEADIVIGTQALFQERVKFPRLGLVVIDEQQRFGVRQRSRLVGKGQHPHVLLMTATPIPRTMALTHYGDLDLSLLQPPPGFKRQVTTRVTTDHNRDKVFSWLRGKLGAGHRGYMVFPVIEEGAAGLEAAEARFKPYRDIDFKGFRIAMIHGRIPIEDRIRTMEAFRGGEIKLLLATSVIEVGVDVPDATLMIVENAERFGLAQLHQLRGRIGRSGNMGYCILLTKDIEGGEAFQRLKKLEEYDDGLTLAEEDLRLRGSGEPLGARQSGSVKFRLADLSSDLKLLQRAHKAAERLLERHPELAPFPLLRAKLKSDYRQRPRTILAG